MKHGRTVFVAVLYFFLFLPKKEYTNNRGHENVKNAPHAIVFVQRMDSVLLTWICFLPAKRCCFSPGRGKIPRKRNYRFSEAERGHWCGCSVHRSHILSRCCVQCRSCAAVTAGKAFPVSSRVRFKVCGDYLRASNLA